MLGPANPRPSVKLSTSSSPRGRLKCCHVPGRSMKRTSTTSTPCAFARSITSRGLVLLPDFLPDFVSDFVSIAICTLQSLGFDGPAIIVGSGGAHDHGGPSRIQGAAFC